MKKQVLSLVISGSLIISLVSGLPLSAFASSNSSLITSPVLTSTQASLYQSDANIVRPITVTLDGQTQETDVSPLISGGVAFISAKDFSSLCELSMTWNDKRKEIVLADKNTTVILKIGSASVLINNKVQTLPHAIFVASGSAMLPVKYLANAFGFQVTWDNAQRQIALTSPAEAVAATAPAIALLSYDEAIKAGIRKSPDYQSSLLSKDRITSQDDDLYISPGTYNLEALKAKQDLKMYKSWADKQILLTMEQVGNNVKNQMDDLSILFAERQNQQDQLDLITEKLRLESMKYDNGMTSLQSLIAMQTSQQMQVQNLILSDQKINAAYVTLNQTLGNPANYRNTLEYDVSYSPIGKVGLDKKIIDDTASDPFIWYAVQNVDSKEFKLNMYEYNIMGGQSWTLTAMDLTEARKNLNDTKTALAGVIRDRYQNLLQIEDHIRLLELNLEQARDNVNAIRLQYDLGNAIKLQVEEAQMSIPDLEYQIQSLKQQHEQLKILFEKPYLAPTYAKAS